MATYSVWQSFITDGGEKVVPSAEITVYLESSGAVATLYSTETGTVLANPFTAGADGFAQFFAPAGVYKVTARKDALDKSFRFVQLGTAASRDIGTGLADVLSVADSDTRYTRLAPWNLTQCPFPLDDNGTLAASLGYMTAGPAIGDGQTLGLTSDGGNHVHVLLSAGALTTARFSRGAAPIGYEAAEVTNTGGVMLGFVCILITDSGGVLVNAGTVQTTLAGLSQIEVAPDGTVSAKRNGAPYVIQWAFPAGQTTVGATDKFCPYLAANDNSATAGDYIEIKLITSGDIMTGTFTSGAVDLCDNVIGGSYAGGKLPNNPRVGSLYEVVVAGTYSAVSYAVGDVGLLKLNGTTMTKIPA